MNTIELLAVGIRLLGLYLLFKSLQFLASAYFSYHQVSLSMHDFNPFMISGGYIVSALLMFLCCGLFIKFPVTVADKLLPRVGKTDTELSGDAVQLQLAGFSLLGVYILSWAIPDLINNFALLAFIPNDDPSYSSGSNPYDIINLAVTVVEVVIGLYLVLQSQGLVNLIKRLRYAGA